MLLLHLSFDLFHPSMLQENPNNIPTGCSSRQRQKPLPAETETAASLVQPSCWREAKEGGGMREGGIAGTTAVSG